MKVGEGEEGLPPPSTLLGLTRGKETMWGLAGGSVGGSALQESKRLQVLFPVGVLTGGNRSKFPSSVFLSRLLFLENQFF